MRKFLLIMAVCLSWVSAHAALAAEEPLAPVVLSSLSPPEVSENGGTHLHIYGQNFVSPMRVYVGWDDCDRLRIISTEEIECIVPPHAQGQATLMVRRGVEKPLLRKKALLYIPELLVVTPATVDLMTRKGVTFKTKGGNPPYTYSILSGPGKIDSSSGELSSDVPGAGVVRVTDAKARIGEAAYSINQQVISIDPPTLSVATNWTTKFAGKGGYPPYSFTVSAGPGKVDASTGNFVSDVPGSGIIRVTDSGGSVAEATFAVYQETITLETKSTSMTTAQTAKFVAKGGTTPYVFSVVSGPGQVDPSSGEFRSDTPGSSIVRVMDRGRSVADSPVISIVQAPTVAQTLAQLKPGESSLLEATGGWGPYKYEVLDAAGGSWMEKSHVFVAGTRPGTAKIRITDSRGTVTEMTIEILNDDMQPRLVAVGHQHSCVIRNGDVYCWGDNSHGQLGNPDPEFRRSSEPLKVPGLSTPVTSIVAGMYHTCALVKGGVQCWGANDSGQLGTGAFTQAHDPVPVFGLDDGVRGIVAGDSHTCAVLSRGLLCWGKNDYGQLGHGVTESEPYPVAVKGFQRQRVNAVAGGESHSCASASLSGVPYAGDEVLSCWGRNFSGQLGSGNTKDSVTPVAVSDVGSGIKDVVAGWAHSCAMLNDSVKCWGFNGIGSAGLKPGPNEIKPQLVPPVTGTMTSMAAGQYHTCAVASGNAYCWGYNFYGQVGNGQDQNVSTPVKVTGLPAGIIDIATSDEHTCAVREGGDTYCWGNNGQGQLGDREYDLHVTPFQVDFSPKKKRR